MAEDLIVRLRRYADRLHEMNDGKPLVSVDAMREAADELETWRAGIDPWCMCDGGRYFTNPENMTRKPFIVNDRCPLHGRAATRSPAASDERASMPVATSNARGFNPSYTIFDEAWQNISGRDDLWGGCARRDEVLAEVERIQALASSSKEDADT